MMTRSGDEIYIRTSGFPVDIDSDYVPLCGSLECNQGRGRPCGNNCAEVKAAQAEGARMSSAPRVPRVMSALIGYRKATWWRKLWARWREWRADRMWPKGGGAMNWQPIETAPKEKELLVGRFVNDEWRICQSGFYFDQGNDREGEPAYWYWHCDWDQGSVTDGEGPTHWMPLPEPPK